MVRKRDCIESGMIMGKYIYIECIYENDEINGIHRVWHWNGQILQQCNYLNGKKEDMCRKWHKNGQMSDEIYYTDDVEGSYRCWTKDGQIESACIHIDGLDFCRYWSASGRELN